MRNSQSSLESAISPEIVLQRPDHFVIPTATPPLPPAANPALPDPANANLPSEIQTADSVPQAGGPRIGADLVFAPYPADQGNNPNSQAGGPRAGADLVFAPDPVHQGRVEVSVQEIGYFVMTATGITASLVSLGVAINDFGQGSQISSIPSGAFNLGLAVATSCIGALAAQKFRSLRTARQLSQRNQQGQNLELEAGQSQVQEDQQQSEGANQARVVVINPDGHMDIGVRITRPMHELNDQPSSQPNPHPLPGDLVGVEPPSSVIVPIGAAGQQLVPQLVVSNASIVGGGPYRGRFI